MRILIDSLYTDAILQGADAGSGLVATNWTELKNMLVNRTGKKLSSSLKQ